MRLQKYEKRRNQTRKLEKTCNYPKNMKERSEYRKIKSAWAIVSTASVLRSSASVSAEKAKEHAETEFEKYRIVQDCLFQSDFDKYLGELPFDNEKC